MSESSKSAMLTVKLSPERLEEFRIASMLRGTTMSSLVSQFVAQVVREEMIAVPEAFKRRSSAAHDERFVDLLHPKENGGLN